MFEKAMYWKVFLQDPNKVGTDVLRLTCLRREMPYTATKWGGTMPCSRSAARSSIRKLLEKAGCVLTPPSLHLTLQKTR